MGLQQITFCFTILLGISLGHIKSGSNFPSGLDNQMVCGRQSWMKLYVCDPYKVLGPRDTEASQLDKLIKQIANETKCPCSAFSCLNNPGGYQIGIAVLNKFPDEAGFNVDDDLYDQSESQARLLTRNLNEAQKFAQGVKVQWKLGYCGEDVIIVYSHEDRVVYTTTGPVASRKLTQKLIQDIAMNARRNGFGSSAFDGLFSIVNDYRAVFLDSYRQRVPKSAEAHSNDSSPFLAASPMLILVSYIALVKAYLAF